MTTQNSNLPCFKCKNAKVLLLFLTLSFFSNQASTVNGQTFSPGNECISIGIIEAGGYQNTVTRFNDIGITNITTLNVTSDSTVLAQFDIIYLATGWASGISNDFELIESQANSYHSYVANGGNLLIEQPNPFTQPNDMVTPMILPYPVTFIWTYDILDLENGTEILDDSHPLTEGFGSEALPNAADTMLDVDLNYHILAVGSNSQNPALLTANFGEGRILIYGGNTTPANADPISDAFIEHMIHWFGSGHVTENHFSCEDFWWYGDTYSESNYTAFHIESDGNGCQEYISLNLTIPEEIVPEVTTETNVLMAEPSDLIYQWITCGANQELLEGETDQTFVAMEDGAYAVVISNAGCTYQSDCFSITYNSINELNQNEEIIVFPVPTKNFLNLKFHTSVSNVNITLINELGQTVFTTNFSGDQLELDTSMLSPGVYIIQLDHIQTIKTMKFIKS